MVVGGGPGGMECAILLAKRGFAVTLLEKSGALGGTLNIAKLPPFKANLQGITDVMALEMAEAGVTVKLNTGGNAGAGGIHEPRGRVPGCGRAAGGAQVHPRH